MKRSALFTLMTVLILALTALPALAGGTMGDQMKKGDMVSVTGEVIDSACYIKMGAKGAGHAQCAEACAKAGIPLAILQDGTNQVIWVASNKDAHSANDDLIPYVAKKVTVTGHYAERGGAKLLVMDSVQPAS